MPYKIVELNRHLVREGYNPKSYYLPVDDIRELRSMAYKNKAGDTNARLYRLFLHYDITVVYKPKEVWIVYYDDDQGELKPEEAVAITRYFS